MCVIIIIDILLKELSEEDANYLLDAADENGNGVIDKEGRTCFMKRPFPMVNGPMLFIKRMLVLAQTEEPIVGYKVKLKSRTSMGFQSLTSNHLPLTAMGSIPIRDFILLHVRKLSSWVTELRWLYACAGAR